MLNSGIFHLYNDGQHCGKQAELGETPRRSAAWLLVLSSHSGPLTIEVTIKSCSPVVDTFDMIHRTCRAHQTNIEPSTLLGLTLVLGIRAKLYAPR